MLEGVTSGSLVRVFSSSLMLLDVGSGSTNKVLRTIKRFAYKIHSQSSLPRCHIYEGITN